MEKQLVLVISENYSYHTSVTNINSSLRTDTVIKLDEKEELPPSFSNNTVYVSPKLKIKRDKLKSVLDSTKSRVIRDYTKSDYIILSEEYVNSESTVQYTYFIENNPEYITELQCLVEEIKKEVLTQNINLTDRFRSSSYYLQRNTYGSLIRSIEEIIEILSKNPTIKEIYFQGYFKNIIEEVLNRYLKNSLTKKSFLNSEYKRQCTYSMEVLNLYEYVVDNNKKIYSEEGLTKMISKDSTLVVIDENMFNTLADMLKSKDETNRTMALEIMGNCQYDSSYFYLLQLLRENKNYIVQTHGVKHKNFMSLLTYFGFNSVNSYYNFDFSNLEQLFNKINSHGKLTGDFIKQHLNKIISSKTDSVRGSKFFKIKEIIIEGEDIPEDCKMIINTETLETTQI
jgi:hypothetical protein